MGTDGGDVSKISGKLTLIIMDGVGLSPYREGNAFQQANTPTLDRLMASCRMTTLAAHGKAVGMPSDSDMGNSEVGHNALGAGQVIDQGASLVNQAFANGSLFEGPVWRALTDQLRQSQGTLHLIGLLSDGNVHSHIDHLEALIDGAHDAKVHAVRLHVLLDGRDVGETTAHLYLDRLERKLTALRMAGFDICIASGGGRMVLTMDRYEADWDMVQRGWEHHVLGEGRGFKDARTAVEALRSEQPGVIDQFLPGFVIVDEHGPVGTIQDGDGVVFFNFRGDRALEISRAFESGPEFTAFNRKRVPKVFYAGMMQYDGDLCIPKQYLVGPPRIDGTLTECLLDARLAQFAISETQKYGHVTYFWNGNRSGITAPSLECFVEVASDRVPFEERPWMKAAEISDAMIRELRNGDSRFLRVNYANGDMVGHTGNLQATIAAMTCLDLELARVLAAVEATGGVALVTADHGNAEQMFEMDAVGHIKLDEQGNRLVKTSHTLNRVPFILFDPHGQVKGCLRQEPSLALSNVAATVTELLGVNPLAGWRPSLLVP
ncbi:MAG: 2,3-bisphosphoglycerate-independent phosphoglycerate mutase [Acidobacteria bacterium]|nr:2,3-bisphosphoglycerate-independent phosphoglycerate mutase [Acidobacteriota bacterium]